MKANLIQIECDRGVGSAEMKKLIKSAVNTALKAERVDVPCYVSVYLTGDEGIHELNLEYRDTDRPTDVLSFPMLELIPGEFEAPEDEIDPDTGRLPIGDIAISVERAEAQAEEFGHSAEREVAYLTVHSVLHQLGYDHMDEGEEKRKMREREEAIMALMGLEIKQGN